MSTTPPDHPDVARLTGNMPSGAQYEIRHGSFLAVITEVGAGLRSFRAGDREWLDTYEADEMASAGRGQVLAPWPGRIAQGRYSFEGADHQLPINEVAREAAIHGLARWLNWTPIRHETDRLTLALMLYAQPGYPFVLRLEVEYALTSSGLTIRTTARNLGATPLPFGAGQHPYFTLGASVVDDAILTIPAQSYIPVDKRLIPQGSSRSVEGTPFDFRTPRAIGSAVLDTGYTDLRFTDGWARVALASPDGRVGLTILLDEAHQYLQVFTGDDLHDPARRRRGVAIEPYTCASNAFNNGLGLRILPPGDSFACAWGILVRPDQDDGNGAGKIE